MLLFLTIFKAISLEAVKFFQRRYSRFIHLFSASIGSLHFQNLKIKASILSNKLIMVPSAVVIGK